MALSIIYISIIGFVTIVVTVVIVEIVVTHDNGNSVEPTNPKDYQGGNVILSIINDNWNRNINFDTSF